MITAVDTSVVLDVVLPDEEYGPQSLERLRDAYDQGGIVICDTVYAELVPAFPDRATLDGALREIGATISPIDTAIAYEAGVRRARHRQAGGPRSRIMTDFIIGAHAVAVADIFLTQDRGFYATHCPELTQNQEDGTT